MERSLEPRLSWLGGIIDGEGCIGASIHTAKRKGGAPTNQLVAAVHIGNTDERVIREAASIADLCGLRYNIYLRRMKNERHRDLWELIFNSGPRVEALLAYVMPYLVGKHDQADLLLRLIRHRRAITAHPRRNEKGQVLGDLPVLADPDSLDMTRELAAMKRR